MSVFVSPLNSLTESGAIAANVRAREYIIGGWED